MGGDKLAKPDHEVKTGQQAEKRIDGGQQPPHPPDTTHPKPNIHWEGVPDKMRGDMEDLLQEDKALWAGRLEKVDVTQHRIEMTPGSCPRRA